MPGRLSLQAANLTGAVLAVLIYLLVILVFSSRMLGNSRAEHTLGAILIVLGLPLLYLLVNAPAHGRPLLYYIQLSLMLAYLVVELLLDYVLKLEFRSVRWMTIAYVTLFFGATGGMIGVASHAGKPWTFASVALFLVMAVLAFVQRAKTGM
jgi:hypothetical protein